MLITSKGQVTIPLSIRNALGLLPHTEVEFVQEKGKVYIKKVATKNQRGKTIIDHLRGSASVKMTTDEIMQLLRGDDE